MLSVLYHKGVTHWEHFLCLLPSISPAVKELTTSVSVSLAISSRVSAERKSFTRYGRRNLPKQNAFLISIPTIFCLTSLNWRRRLVVMGYPAPLKPSLCSTASLCHNEVTNKSSTTRGAGYESSMYYWTGYCQE